MPAYPPPPGPPPPPVRHYAGFVVGLVGVVAAGLGFGCGALIWLGVAAVGDVRHHPQLYGQAAAAVNGAQLVTGLDLALAITLLVRCSRHQGNSLRVTRALIAIVVLGAAAAVALWIAFMNVTTQYSAR